MTPQSIIALARYVIQDTGVNTAEFRQTNDELVAYVNLGIKEMATMRPDLFCKVDVLTCTPGQCEQTLVFPNAIRLLDVLCIHDGNALTPMDRASMDLFKPGWRTDAAAAAEQWAPLDGDPLRFFIYPPAPADQVLDVKFVQSPGAYALTEEITLLPAAYESALADYVIYRAESKDDEHVLNERAAAHFTAFKLKTGA